MRLSLVKLYLKLLFPLMIVVITGMLCFVDMNISALAQDLPFQELELDLGGDVLKTKPQPSQPPRKITPSPLSPSSPSNAQKNNAVQKITPQMSSPSNDVQKSGLMIQSKQQVKDASAKQQKPKQGAKSVQKPPASTLIQGTVQEKHGTDLRVERVDFYHKIDEEVNYLTLKKDWLKLHPTSLSLVRAGKLAEEAFTKSNVLKPLEVWRYHGGPNPKVFTAKAHIYNDSPEAHLNKKFRVEIKAKIGAIRVDSQTLLVDFDHLDNSGRWIALSSQILEVPAIAPNEEFLLDIMQLNMLAFQARYPNQWPREIHVWVNLVDTDSEAERTLILTPDHFLVEGLIP